MRAAPRAHTLAPAAVQPIVSCYGVCGCVLTGPEMTCTLTCIYRYIVEMAARMYCRLKVCRSVQYAQSSRQPCLVLNSPYIGFIDARHVSLGAALGAIDAIGQRHQPFTAQVYVQDPHSSVAKATAVDQTQAQVLDECKITAWTESVGWGYAATVRVANSLQTRVLRVSTCRHLPKPIQILAACSCAGGNRQQYRH